MVASMTTPSTYCAVISPRSHSIDALPRRTSFLCTVCVWSGACRDGSITTPCNERPLGLPLGSVFVTKQRVSRLGFEPRTLGLKVRCSARLSYRPVCCVWWWTWSISGRVTAARNQLMIAVCKFGWQATPVRDRLALPPVRAPASGEAVAFRALDFARRP